jgi:hypothetical protein
VSTDMKDLARAVRMVPGEWRNDTWSSPPHLDTMRPVTSSRQPGRRTDDGRTGEFDASSLRSSRGLGEAGKSTVAALLHGRLEAYGRSCILAPEFSDSPLGQSPAAATQRAPRLDRPFWLSASRACLPFWPTRSSRWSAGRTPVIVADRFLKSQYGMEYMQRWITVGPNLNPQSGAPYGG